MSVVDELLYQRFFTQLCYNLSTVSRSLMNLKYAFYFFAEKITETPFWTSLCIKVSNCN